MGGFAGHVGTTRPHESERSRPTGPRAASFASRSGRAVAVFREAAPPGHSLNGGDVATAFPGEPLAAVCEADLHNGPGLLAALGARPRPSRDRTDAQVLLAAYRAWGDALVHQLRGSFAFVLWDGRADGRLLLARDAFGQKPLYYRLEPGGPLRFASELRGLLDCAAPAELDAGAVRFYLEHGHPPPHRCMLRGVGRLPPGRMLLWESGRLLQRAFGPVTAHGDVTTPSDELWRAVQAHLAGGEPAGLLISGTPASAALLTCAVEQSPVRVRTYAACLGVAGLDDAERARRTARRLGARHRFLMVNAAAGRLLPYIASQLNEPVADPRTITDYVACRRAAREVALLLSSRGADGPLASPHRGSPRRNDERLTESVMAPFARICSAAGVRARVPCPDTGVAGWLSASGTHAPGRWGSRESALPDPGGRARVPEPRPSLPASSWRCLDEWFRCEWHPMARDVLLSPRAQQRPWADPTGVHRLLGEHMAGRRRHGRRLFRLLMLELWARSLHGNEPGPTPPNTDRCARELPPDRPARKVAVIAPAGMGNAVRLTPALRRLGEADPAVSVTLYVSAGRGSHEVSAGIPPVDRHVPFRPDGLGALRLVRDLRRTRFDDLVSTWVSRWSAAAGLLSGVPRRRTWLPDWWRARDLLKAAWNRCEPYDPPPSDTGNYDIRAFGRLVGVELAGDVSPRFAAPIWEGEALARAREQVRGLRRPLLAVNAAARADLRQREYPLALMRESLTMLLQEQTVGAVVLFGDGAAQRRLAPLARAVRGRGLNVCGRLTIGESATLMSECDAVLTVDGGLLHVALCTDLPVVALYGPTEVFRTDPRGEAGRYVTVSAFEQCRCRCLPHRGIRVRAACREEAECLGAVHPRRIVEAVRSVVRPCPVH
jgi:ADP-heptose:LPS heptosyltransferase